MIKPLPGYVLIEPIEDEPKSGEVYLPETSKDKPSKGKVIACGSDVVPKHEYPTPVHECGTVCPVKVDQKVIYKKWTNQEVQSDRKKYLLVKFDELLGVIE